MLPTAPGAEPVTLAEAEPAPEEPFVAEPAAAPAVVPRKAAPAPVAEPLPVRQYCADCGTVVSIENVQRRGKGSGVGAVAGGVVGGILGNQVGKGTGRDLATIAGAVIGGVAGHNVERNVTPRIRYRTTVRMDNGQMHSFTQDAPPVWTVGDVIQVPEVVAADSPSATTRRPVRLRAGRREFRDPSHAPAAWRLCRQDDNGNVFVVETLPDFATARQRCEAFEALGHKQAYWIEAINKPA